MSLIHVYFNDKPDGVSENYVEYKSIIKERDSIQESLLVHLDQSILSKKEFLEIQRAKTLEYKNKIKACNKAKSNIIKDFKFNGRSSFHYWLFVFGLSFSFFFLAIRYTYRIIIDYKDKYLKKSLVLEASAWMAVSLFWVIHSVFVKNADLPTPIYTTIMFGICLLVAFSIFYFIKYLIHRKTHTLESYRKSIVRLVTLISDIRINHYFVMAASATTKDNEDVIKKDVEIVDEKIFSTIEKVADES